MHTEPPQPAPHPNLVAAPPLPTATTPAACDVVCPIHKYVVIVPWSAQILVAVLLAQTLFFKFTYAPETQQIFEPLGGRPVATAVGLVELLAVALVLVRRTAALGALLALGVIGGAIVTHLTRLGIAVVDPETGMSDGGLLFGMALAVAFGALVVLWYRRADLPVLGRRWANG
jgi:uncharacterized membrane protein YphA (DoxX/SURF4 family)